MRFARSTATLGLPLVALAVTSVLPEHGLGLFLRLGAATFVVLAPGRLIARALGFRGTSAAFIWSLAAIGAALAVVFVTRTSIDVMLGVLLAIALGTLLWRRPEPQERRRGVALVASAGVLLGLLLWHLAPMSAQGDSLFHLARVRKLVELGSLTPWSLDELSNGGLHPGYAFPLWHAFLAAVAKLAGVDPTLVVQHESSLLVPIALLVAYEAGTFLFRSTLLGGAVAVAQLALIVFAPGHGVTYPLLVRPAPAARQLIVPAVLALVFAHVEQRSRRLLLSIAAGSLALSAVHPTYAAFLCIPLAGWLGVRAIADPSDVRALGQAVLAIALPLGAVSLALVPVLKDTLSHSTTDHYREQLTFHGSNFGLAAEVFGRGGAVAVAALVLIPVTALAWRRRWAAFTTGGSLAVLLVMLVPVVFTHFSDLVSLSQSRRAAGFLPFPFVFVGGMLVLARLAPRLLLPLSLAAGIVMQILWPGDFGYRLVNGGPALATWIGALGGAVVLGACVLLRRTLDAGDRAGVAALAAALFALPVVVHGFIHWTPVEIDDPYALTPGLVAAIREDVPKRGVVFSDLETSYRIAAYAPVLVAAAPVEHVADTKSNNPYKRREDVYAFYASGDLAIPRRYGAQWLVLSRDIPHAPLSLPATYADERFLLYKLPQ
jgi:hypothetical protein